MPGLAADTFTETMQVLPGNSDSIKILTLFAPLLPVVIVGPQSVLKVKFGGEATTTPLGRGSAKAIPPARTEFGLFTVKLRLDVPLGRIELGVNALESVTAVTAVNVAVAAVPGGNPVAVIVLVVLL